MSGPTQAQIEEFMERVRDMPTTDPSDGGVLLPQWVKDEWEAKGLVPPPEQSFGDTFGQQFDYAGRHRSGWLDRVSPVMLVLLTITIQLAAITIFLGVIVAKLP